MVYKNSVYQIKMKLFEGEVSGFRDSITKFQKDGKNKEMQEMMRKQKVFMMKQEMTGKHLD